LQCGSIDLKDLYYRKWILPVLWWCRAHNAMRPRANMLTVMVKKILTQRFEDFWSIDSLEL